MSKSDTSARLAASAVWKYGTAVLCVAAAVAIAKLLQGFMDVIPLFYAAVIVSTWFAGRGPGLLAVLLATLSVDYFFVPPLYTFTFGIYIIPRLAVFLMSALLIAWLSDKRKRAETSLRQARDEMEAKVQERTADLKQANEKLQAEIAERTRAEEALRESERRYRYIFQAAGVSIWEEDFSQVNVAIAELKARGVQDFRQYVNAHPEFVQQAITMVKVIDVNDATLKLFGAGSKDELLVSLHKVFLPETGEVFAGELIAIAEGRTFFESETVLQTLNGDKLAVLLTITFPPQPARLDRVLVSIMDITERKRAEEALAVARAELAHVTRVTTMGELTSSIAHEVNQPLAAIVTNANACLRWLANQPPNLDEARESVGRIVRDGHRASEVVGRVRALFRKAAPDKVWLDINDLIQDVLALVPGEVRRNRIQLRTEFADGLPPVLGDRVQLQQVLLNLVVNAIEAMSTVSDRPRKLLIRSQQNDATSVLVMVQDSGIGIEAQNPAQIFDAFYTTKPDGLGMGLSISRTTIEGHGGRLWATSNDGSGATFQFTLPTNAEDA
jgi:PAS domain S-box-containing protein